MKTTAIRITLDVPVWLYRRLKEQAASQDCSVREVVLAGMRRGLLEDKGPRAKRVRFPLIASKGPKVHLSTNKSMNALDFLDANVWRALEPSTHTGRKSRDVSARY